MLHNRVGFSKIVIVKACSYWDWSLFWQRKEMILFKTLYISSLGEKSSACSCIYLRNCRQIQSTSPCFRAKTEVKSTCTIKWDSICGDIKAAGVSAVKVLEYSLPMLEDWANIPSWRGNTFADDRNGKDVIKLIFCPGECVKLLSQRHTFLSTARSETGNKVRIWEGKSAHHRNAVQSSLHFFITKSSPSDICCLYFIF